MFSLTRYKEIFAGIAALLLLAPAGSRAGDIKVGTWKTPQTIQPFFYEKFFPQKETLKVFSFTNPADQKVALLAGSLDMCGTTLAHAIHSASFGQPVVVVAALCNKCSALVVKKDGRVKAVKDLKGMKMGYVPGQRNIFRLIRTCGSRRPSLSERICAFWKRPRPTWSLLGTWTHALYRRPEPSAKGWSPLAS